MKHIRRSSEPMDDETRVAGEVAEHVPEGYSAVIMIIKKEDGQTRHGTKIHQFENEADAIVCFLRHVRGVCASFGLPMEIVPLPGSPSDN